MELLKKITLEELFISFQEFLIFLIKKLPKSANFASISSVYNAFV